MSMTMHGRIATLLVSMAALAVTCASTSVADDPVAVGATCPNDQLGNAATTPDGAPVRCLATEQGGFSWMADTGAAGTLADLQKQGFTITIDRIGTGNLSDCKVIDVRNPVTVTQTTRNPIGPHTPEPLTIITLSKTISVSLDCTPNATS
ncbi:hypothetical protein [Mycolicibacterium sp. 050158]|uniref:hypothetical protein n=1 Tax=Mycolicibacterium sp. 050158 TaxID=3090602 RepID=UPI00299CDA95|nr:hypothetical protein [Mycolicibacterium sp. 050158]MDX1891198.1 hypothetical protein [Mycolicibacterium sp. 050158]